MRLRLRCTGARFWCWGERETWRGVWLAAVAQQGHRSDVRAAGVCLGLRVLS